MPLNTDTGKYEYGTKYDSQFYKNYYTEHKDEYMARQRERRAKTYIMPVKREFQRLSAIQV